jgi:hypothetical protein
MAGIMAVAPNVMHERREFYRANRLQSTVFRIAAQAGVVLAGGDDEGDDAG